MHSFSGSVTPSFTALQIGLSSEGKVFVVVGYSREQPIGYTELSFQELRKCKVHYIYD